MKFNHATKALLVAAGFCLPFGVLVFGQTATNVAGLYNTGLNNTGGAQTQGLTDSHWTVSYAEVGGVSASQYTGAAYVVVGPLSNQHTSNSTNPPAQWITAPGAKTAATGGQTNTGGSFLPGNGTTGNNSASYVYQLAITIAGSGALGTVVTNQIAISLTIAGDDQYAIYVNPAAGPTVDKNGVISAGGTAASSVNTSAAYKNTTPLTLQNFGASANAVFVIGTNYLDVVVANTNGINGSSSSSTINQAGLLVYQATSQFTTIDGKPVVPEVGAWMPVVLALGLFFRKRLFLRPQTAG